MLIMVKDLITIHTNPGETKLIDTIISLKKGIRYWKYILSSKKTNKERLLKRFRFLNLKN